MLTGHWLTKYKRKKKIETCVIKIFFLTNVIKYLKIYKMLFSIQYFFYFLNWYPKALANMILSYVLKNASILIQTYINFLIIFLVIFDFGGSCSTRFYLNISKYKSFYFQR